MEITNTKNEENPESASKLVPVGPVEEPKSGFTKASFLALIYASIVFVPATMYLTLMVGWGAFPVAWFTLVLWVEVARYFGKPITKQEATMMYILSGEAVYVPLAYVQRAYYRNSAIAYTFGIAPEMPTWYVPAPETGIWESRMLFHPAWLQPILLDITVTTLMIVLAIATASFAYGLFVKVEKLPFPLQNVDATGITIISSPERGSKVRYLFLFGLIGFVYGSILYAAPFILQAWTGQQVQIIPIPWVDLNTTIEKFFPGAIFGIATDLSPIAAAFVLPTSSLVGIIVGSFAVRFFGNWLTVAYNLGPVRWWLPGMNIQMSVQRSYLYFWAAPFVGLALSAGIVPILRHPKVITNALKVLRRSSVVKGSSEVFVSPKLFLVIYAACTLVGVLFFVMLAPDFPFYIILPLIIGFPILNTLIGGRMLGEAGVSFAPQAATLSSTIYLASGYPKVDVWFVPNISGSTGEGWLRNFKVCELTRTKTFSYVKMLFALLPIAMIVGFIFVQIFWSLAPIPSGRYPGAATFWPIEVAGSCLWIRGVGLGLFNPLWIAAAFGVGGAIYLVTDFVGIPTGAFIGLIGGAITSWTITPFAVTYGIGILIALVLKKLVGHDWWEDNKMLLSAGLMMGEGIAVSLGISIVLIINSIWTLPF